MNCLYFYSQFSGLKSIQNLRFNHIVFIEKFRMQKNRLLLILAIFTLCLVPTLSITCQNDPNCDQDTGCTSGQACSECLPGFFKNTVSTYCYPCSVSNCKKCDTKRETCDECTQNYTLVDNRCQGNPQIGNCSTFKNYDGEVGCQVCDNSYYTSTDHSTCLKCPTGCATCQSAIKCLTCSDGFYSKTANGRTYCAACMTGCKECSGTITCSACYVQNGFYQNDQLVCKACSSNCLQCTDNKTCTTCAEGYFKQTVDSVVSCKACKSNCVACSDSNTCSKCKNAYMLSSNTCTACSIDKCAKYVSETNPCQCAECSSGTLQEGDTKCIVCEIGCKTCSSTTVCTQADAGYYLDNADCFACSKVKENCAACTKDSCSGCKDGYYLDGGVCKACSADLDNCLKCESSTVCTECIAGNVLKTDKSGCFECGGLDAVAIADCNSCSNEHICQKCNTGFYLDLTSAGTDSCSECNTIDIDCQLCTTDKLCTKFANDGKYVDGSIKNCNEMHAQCKQCAADGQECFVCNAGYYPVQKACQSCSNIHVTCQECSDSETCTKCSTGYFVDKQGSCQSCSVGVNHCTTCDSLTVCKGCNTGYYLDATGICRLCPTGCNTCKLVSGAIQCNECSNKYLYDALKKTCNKCAEGCKDGCVGEVTACKDGECAPGYDQDTGSTCVFDQKCTKQHCMACDSTTDAYCTMCEAGYLAMNGECLLIENNCNNYDFDGYYTSKYSTWQTSLDDVISKLAADGKVKLALEDSSLASPIDEEHKYQYFLVYLAYKFLIAEGFSDDALGILITAKDTEIVAIINNETKSLAQKGSEIFLLLSENLRYSSTELTTKLTGYVFDQLTCSGCLSGYKLISGQCKLCGVLHCITCQTDTTTQCSSCEDGYYLDAGTKKCIWCSSSCKTCTGEGEDKCNTCFEGWSKHSDGHCVKCEGACLTCDQNKPYNCLTCIQPFSQSPDENSKCYLCDQKTCRKCLSTDKSFCLQCSQGTLVAGTCQECSANCVSCYSSSVSDCITCKSGYLLTAGGCIQCPLFCSTCSSESVCTTCLDGYYDDENGKCQPCMDGCATCDTADSCKTYQDGIVFKNGVLSYCPTGCDNCNPQKISQCVKCSVGFFLNNYQCKACSKNCESCTSAKNCDVCRSRTHREKYDTVNNYYQCRKCKGECETCESDNLEKCLTCRQGYTLSGSRCARFCEVGCAICSDYDPKVCETCAQGYGLSQKGKCVKCAGGCSGKCDPKNIKSCLSCAKGFFQDAGSCKRCPSGCTACNKDAVCTSCIDGYRLKDGVCVERCRFPCLECSGKTCKKCAPDFTLNGGVCQTSLSCNPSCDHCPPGSYELSSGQCTLCSVEHCATCSDSECTTCFEGYYLQVDANTEEQSCVECAADCKICKGSEYCEVCAGGYLRKINQVDSDGTIVYSGECQACSPECANCFIRPEYCLTCSDDRKLNGTTCIGRRVVSLSYIFNADYDTFLSESGIQKITTSLCDAMGIDVSQLYIKDIRKGSTQVDILASATTEEMATSLKSSAEKATFDYPVTSSSIGIFYDDQVVTIDGTTTDPTTDDPAAPTDELDTTLIVGVVLGGVILIMIIAFIVYVVKKNSPYSPKVGDLADEGSHDHIKPGSDQQIIGNSYSQSRKK